MRKHLRTPGSIALTGTTMSSSWDGTRKIIWAQDLDDMQIIGTGMFSVGVPVDSDPKRAATAEASTGDSPQAAVRSVVEQPSSAVETARLDLSSVDLPVATFWQKLTHGITRIFTGGERGTRTRHKP